ncbi:hypothetical protein OGAPHI_004730 [Ogataea philodendri]|uniref:Uncharacterized protein n=1 Tax=Ogataea philodendri TaxID=1378263 RepID=A0A9P8P2U7_9ASCO|nr:uncharacterized protein OGAPHI_004730 [Ogataea philodendri]KAH3664016.1 hypothetical protein OGAPHI_004730 [Ogataea philodendri]
MSTTDNQPADLSRQNTSDQLALLDPYTPVSPPLPPRHRAQSTEPQKPTPEDRPALPQRPRPAKKYGMKRASVEDFEVHTPLGSPIAQRTSSHVSRSTSLSVSKEASLQEINLEFLLDSQTVRIKRTLDSLPDELKLSQDEYLTSINSKDHWIELRSEIEAGNYSNPDKVAVYELVLKSPMVRKFAPVSAPNPELSKQLESLNVQQETAYSELAPVCGKLAVQTLPPLLVRLYTVHRSPQITFLLAKLYEQTNLRQLVFLVLRIVETIDASVLVRWWREHESVYEYVAREVGSEQFWLRVTAAELDVLLHRVVLYGFDSLAGDVANLLCGARVSAEVSSRVVLFSHEFQLLGETVREPEELRRQKNKLHRLQEELEEKHAKYNELLNNYKQLNEEKFSNQTAIKKLEANNGQLRLKRNESERKLNALLSNYEVIRVNNEKNTEIHHVNEKLRAEISRMEKELGDLNGKKR